MHEKEPMKTMQVRLPNEHIKALDALAKQNMGSRGQEVRKAVRNYIEPYTDLYPVKKRPVEE